MGGLSHTQIAAGADVLQAGSVDDGCRIASEDVGSLWLPKFRDQSRDVGEQNAFFDCVQTPKSARAPQRHRRRPAPVELRAGFIGAATERLGSRRRQANQPTGRGSSIGLSGPPYRTARPSRMLSGRCDQLSVCSHSTQADDDAPMNRDRLLPPGAPQGARCGRNTAEELVSTTLNIWGARAVSPRHPQPA